MESVIATMHDGASIDVTVEGDGPTVLLAVDPTPAEGAQAEEMVAWGADPALGRSLVEGLVDVFRVAAFPYESHVLARPKPDTLTPDAVVADVLAVADAVGADGFAYYGYSWLALVGLQLAIRTDRLTALVMGGFPPLSGPYAAMLAVTEASHRMATNPPPPRPGEVVAGDWSTVDMELSEGQTRQFVTLYRDLEAFDDEGAQGLVSCPRMCFVGSEDRIEYDDRWDGAVVDIAGSVVARREELRALGWQVEVLPGLDHAQAMQAGAVLPTLRPWLISESGV
jgi:pimeloyl-ACP methyl ester carboxylesterase